MESKPKPYHFDYQSLDEFLDRTFDPKEVGNQLDAIMSDLVHLHVPTASLVFGDAAEAE